MATFITLTDTDGHKDRVNADHITWYTANNKGGSRVLLIDHDSANYYEETTEQIDALLGVAEKPSPVAELVAVIDLVRGIITEGAQVGFNPTAGDWAQRLYESQGATYRALRAARGE